MTALMPLVPKFLVAYPQTLQGGIWRNRRKLVVSSTFLAWNRGLAAIHAFAVSSVHQRLLSNKSDCTALFGTAFGFCFVTRFGTAFVALVACRALSIIFKWDVHTTSPG